MILGTILITFGFLLAAYIFFDLIKETKRQTALDKLAKRILLTME